MPELSRRYLKGRAIVTIAIQRILVDGNQAAVEWHYEDTEKATGKRSYSDDAIVIEFQNGRTSYWREYFDTNSSSIKPKPINLV
jgi:ketosteroid isomerase-like protein